MATTTQFPNPEERPRGLRFNDPTADIVWAAIQTLDEAAKYEVLDHLRTHMAIPAARRTDAEAQVAKAIAALREAAEVLSERGDKTELSTYRYEALRLELGRKGDWPPESSIRRILAGTWNDALRRAQLDPVADGDAIRVQLGGRLSREECAAAVRECSEETGNPLPTYSYYIAWSRRPDVRRRPGRRPHSQSPFDRNFERWAEVLAVAGLARAGEITGPVLHAPDSSVRSAGAYRWTDEQLMEALRTIVERLGHPPNTGEFPRERERLIAEQESSGEPVRPFPSLSSILNRFCSWDAALTAAGLEPVSGRRDHDGRRKPSRRKIPREEMLAGLREAFEAIGHPFTARAYGRNPRPLVGRHRTTRAPGMSNLNNKLAIQDTSVAGSRLAAGRFGVGRGGTLAVRGAVDPMH